MSSLHKDPRGRSPYWYVAYTGGTGVRCFKSTKETDWHRARVVADAWQRSAEEARRPTYFERIVNDTLRRLGFETREAPTVKEWLAEWLSNQHGSVSSGTLQKYSQVVSQFSGVVGSRKLASITPQDIIRFRDSLLRGGRSPRTVNYLIRLLRIPFRHALAAGTIERDPTALVKALKTPSSSIKGIFCVAEIHSLLQVASTEWQGLILAGFYTGQRLGDLSRLKWTSVELTERSITFSQGKTGNFVKIPLHPKLYDWLAIQSREAPNVFPTLCNKPMAGKTGLSSTFSKLVTQAISKIGGWAL
jgi:integrase